MTDPMSELINREPIAPLPKPQERRRLRTVRGITQKELAEALEVSRQTVVAWERGSEPTEPHRTAYAEILRAWQRAATGKE